MTGGLTMLADAEVPRQTLHHAGLVEQVGMQNPGVPSVLPP
jgi:hypothetical protein